MRFFEMFVGGQLPKPILRKSTLANGDLLKMDLL